MFNFYIILLFLIWYFNVHLAIFLRKFIASVFPVPCTQPISRVRYSMLFSIKFVCIHTTEEEGITSLCACTLQ